MKFFRVILALLGGTHVLYAQSSAVPTVKSTGEYNFPYNVADYYCLENYLLSIWQIFLGIEIGNITRLLNSDLMNARIYVFISDDFIQYRRDMFHEMYQTGNDAVTRLDTYRIVSKIKSFSSSCFSSIYIPTLFHTIINELKFMDRLKMLRVSL